MLRFVVHSFSGLTLLFVVAMVGICSQRFDLDSDVAQVLTPPEECDIPCWQDITPGSTTERELLAILKPHPWVADVRSVSTEWGFTEITVRWSGRQHHLIDGHKPARFEVMNGVVQKIGIPTTLKFGDVWLMLNQPDWGGFAYSTGPGILRATTQIARYEQGLTFYSRLNCQRFWLQPTQIVFSADAVQEQTVLQPYQLEDYLDASCGLTQ